MPVKGSKKCDRCDGMGDCPVCIGEGFVRKGRSRKLVDCPECCTGACEKCRGYGYILPKDAPPIKRHAKGGS